MRSYEATLGLLAPGAVVLLLASGERRRVPARLTFGAWAALLAALGVLVALPLVRSAGGSYQLSALRLSLEAVGVLTRLARHAGWHLGPLFAAPPLWSGRLAQVAAAGLGLGISAWSLPLLTSATVAPATMRGRPAPGFGRMLAAGRCSPPRSPRRLRGSPPRWSWPAGPSRWARRTRSCGSGSGTSTAYPAQRQLLGQLASLAPDLREGTLVVPPDGEGVFPATFTFRHAVSHLCRGQAAGLVGRGHDFLYPARFEADGIASLPWPVVRGPWHEPARLYGYDAVVVVRRSGRALTLEPAWSADLPAAPATRSYAPLARIGAGGRQATVPGGGLRTRP